MLPATENPKAHQIYDAVRLGACEDWSPGVLISRAGPASGFLDAGAALKIN